MVVTSGEHLQTQPNALDQVSGFVVLTFEFHKEGALWVGRCVELGTATDGRSLEKVGDELAEVVTLHLDALDDVGERQRFFETHGLTLYSPDPPAEVERRIAVGERPHLIQLRPVSVSLAGAGTEPARV
jgi:hypothetical protein